MWRHWSYWCYFRNRPEGAMLLTPWFQRSLYILQTKAATNVFAAKECLFAITGQDKSSDSFLNGAPMMLQETRRARNLNNESQTVYQQQRHLCKGLSRNLSDYIVLSWMAKSSIHLKFNCLLNDRQVSSSYYRGTKTRQVLHIISAR